MFQTQQSISRAPHDSQQFVELEVNGFGVTVLSVLDEKHHQERNDGRSGIDHELPGIGVVKQWAGDQPSHDYNRGQHKGPWRANGSGNPFSTETKHSMGAPAVERSGSMKISGLRTLLVHVVLSLSDPKIERG
jgi:hypothetical protein